MKLVNQYVEFVFLVNGNSLYETLRKVEVSWKNQVVGLIDVIYNSIVQSKLDGLLRATEKHSCGYMKKV